MRRTTDELVRVHLRYTLLDVFPAWMQHIECAPIHHDAHRDHGENILLESVIYRLILLYPVGQMMLKWLNYVEFCR